MGEKNILPGREKYKIQIIDLLILENQRKKRKRHGEIDLLIQLKNPSICQVVEKINSITS